MEDIKRVYPKHLYEPVRIEAATSYMKHELRKYLPHLKDPHSWQIIDQDIDTWFDQAPFLFPVRDFWNGFHGILMGFKLYNHLLAFITAENVIWTKQDIPLNQLTFGTINKNITDLAAENNRDLIHFQQNLNKLPPAKRDNRIKEVRAFYQISSERSIDPIIVTQKRVNDEDKLVVYDGNGRVTLALLEGKTAIPAFVSRFQGESRQPVNYWLPTDLLMEVTHFAKKAYESKLPTYEAYVSILKEMLAASQSGQYEMKDRVLTDGEFKEKLSSDLGLKNLSSQA